MRRILLVFGILIVLFVNGCQSANLNQISDDDIELKDDNVIMGDDDELSLEELPRLYSKPFTQDSRGIIRVRAKNFADVAASFDIGTSCQPPFFVDYERVINTGLIDPNQEKIIEIPILGGVDDKFFRRTTGFCTISVYSPNKPQDALKENVSVTVSCKEICEAGTTRCIGRDKSECNPTGCSWEFLGESDECSVQEICASDLDCYDNNKCTKDRCRNSECENKPTLWCRLTGGE